MAKKSKSPRKAKAPRDIYHQLKTAPLVDVLGVLAGDVGGAISQGERQWSLLFSFAVWRIAGGKLRTDELFVRRRVRESEIDKYRKRLPRKKVLRIRARVVEPSLFNRPDALLVKLLGPDNSDPELLGKQKGLQKPVKLKDKTLGTLALDRSVGSFEGKSLWNGRKVALTLWTDKPGDEKKSLQTAHALWRAQKKWHKQALDHAVDELLPQKNDDWLEDDERPLSAKEFRQRLKLFSVSVWPNGTFEFGYDDGDMFGGDWIEVRGSLKKGIEEAEIAG